MKSKEEYVIRRKNGGYLYHGAKNRWQETEDVNCAEHFCYEKALNVINNSIAAGQRTEWEIVPDESLRKAFAPVNHSEAEGVLTEESSGTETDNPNRTFIISTVLIITLLITVIFAVTGHQTKTRYEQGISYLNAGEYKDAKEIFDRLYRGTPDYHEVAELYNYANAAFYYERASFYSMGCCLQYLQSIPEDYSGPFSNEIRNLLKRAGEEYLALEEAETKRLAEEEAKKQKLLEEEARQAEEKARQKAAKIASIPNNPPYIGMDYEYINRTLFGSYSYSMIESYWDSSKKRTVYQKNFYWKNGNTEYFCATVRFTDSEYTSGYVCDVIDRRNEKQYPFSYSKTWSDPYDLEEYSDPDEFYYWHADDFIDYEEAEDYFYGY